MIIHVRTNDLTRNVELLNNVKNIVKQVSRKAPSTNLAFLSIIVRRYKQKLDTKLSETNVHLKNFCLQKSIGFVDNRNIESHLWVKKASP